MLQAPGHLRRGLVQADAAADIAQFALEHVGLFTRGHQHVGDRLDDRIHVRAECLHQPPERAFGPLGEQPATQQRGGADSDRGRDQQPPQLWCSPPPRPPRAAP